MKSIKWFSIAGVSTILTACANVPERGFSTEYKSNFEVVSHNLRESMQRCWARNPVPLKDGFKFDEKQENGKLVFEAYGYLCSGDGCV